jgi:hypothetical protein
MDLDSEKTVVGLVVLDEIQADVLAKDVSSEDVGDAEDYYYTEALENPCWLVYARVDRLSLKQTDGRVGWRTNADSVSRTRWKREGRSIKGVKTCRSQLKEIKAIAGMAKVEMNMRAMGSW